MNKTLLALDFLKRSGCSGEGCFGLDIVGAFSGAP